MSSLIGVCFIFVLFLLFGTMLLFFPTRLIWLVGQLDKHFYTWYYRDYDKIPERLKWKIERATECPEEAEFSICAFRVFGVFAYIGALLTSIGIVSIVSRGQF
jgi:hypothetical protein